MCLASLLWVNFFKFQSKENVSQSDRRKSTLECRSENFLPVNDEIRYIGNYEHSHEYVKLVAQFADLMLHEFLY